ncbi:unnamed protein product [Clonostachys chloroleuca]|uniref:Uncharacterized protein n=1 Tax=Clonostachys chloroleuca TaxID=1926264 RepID=A0AA35MHN5_9HYPO|nr:unnamed protein product [Clonostachys chloroleuca]
MTIKLSMNKAALERPLTGVFVGHAEFGPSGVVVSVPNLLLYEFNLAAPMKTPFEISLPATPVLATVSSLYVILWHAAWRVNLDVGASMGDGITGVIRTHVEFRGGFVVYGVNVALALSIGLRT